MGRSSLSTILPFRFLITIGHLIATILVIYQRKENLLNSLHLNYTLDDYERIDSSLLAAVWLSIIAISFELVSLFFGFSMFLPGVHAYNIASHFLGAIFTSWFTLEQWHYKSMWYIFGLLTIIPAFWEICAIIRIFCCKKHKY